MQYSIVYMYYIFFIHSSVFRLLLCPGLMNIGVHVSFWIMVLSRYMPRSGIAGSYDSSVFSFIRSLELDIQLVSHSDFSYSFTLPIIPTQFETVKSFLLHVFSALGDMLVSRTDWGLSCFLRVCSFV